ncbi:hypothetical protein CISIN_1g034898mg [Citrus sinensis]|uniref:Ubiquitin-like protease family profile domain-containing protein n=1 Tax=Citrus sinensis TaxID=2711 RepID=A0A067D7D3_CITSI|nr:hypothetical protein CISIN_1g034898mg [Citrus sinensis]
MCISNYILSAFKIFVAKMGNADRKSFVWKKVKCPQQTTNVECGYYVIRFMKEIIESQDDSIKKCVCWTRQLHTKRILMK